MKNNLGGLFMRKLMVVLTTVLLLSSAGAGRAWGHEGHDKEGGRFTKHFKETYFALTEKKEFSVEVLPDEKEYKIGKDVVGIVVHNNHDEDVEGATVTVITGEGVQPLAAKEKGGGLYIVSKLDLKKEGAWRLEVRIKKDSVTDRAVFEFPGVTKKLLPPGKYHEDFKQ